MHPVSPTSTSSISVRKLWQLHVNITFSAGNSPQDSDFLFPYNGITVKCKSLLTRSDWEWRETVIPLGAALSLINRAAQLLLIAQGLPNWRRSLLFSPECESLFLGGNYSCIVDGTGFPLYPLSQRYKVCGEGSAIVLRQTDENGCAYFDNEWSAMLS